MNANTRTSQRRGWLTLLVVLTGPVTWAGCQAGGGGGGGRRTPPNPCRGVVCDDGNACTTDTCDGTGQCQFTPKPCEAGQSCNPGNGQCEPDDPCSGVVCASGESCDEATGLCVSDNQNPIADAGAPQSKMGEDLVTLQGWRSYDPEGVPLNYAWDQLTGPDVVLDETFPESPSFTAPDKTTTLTFELTVDDGSGGIASTTVDIFVTRQPRLFIVSNFTGNVVTYKNPSAVFPPTKEPDSNATGLSGPMDLTINSADQLVVANSSTPSVDIYNNITENLNGRLASVDGVDSSSGHLNGPASVVYTEENLLFVADQPAGKIWKYDNSPGAVRLAHSLPARLDSSEMGHPMAIAMDSMGTLYVADDFGQIVAYDDAASLDSDTLDPRVFFYTDFTLIMDLFIDADDNLFVLDNDGQVFTYYNPFALDDPLVSSAPDVELNITVDPAWGGGASWTSGMAVDSDGTGYIADAFTNRIYIYDDLIMRHSLMGLPPDDYIGGDSPGFTHFTMPTRLFILE